MATIISDGEQAVPNPNPPRGTDVDPGETKEWLDSLLYVLDSKGRERAQYLLAALNYKAAQEGVELPLQYNTPYINTIPQAEQPPYPGNRDIERRIKSIVRWNAMAMVVRANKRFDGLGGHISTFASSATLYEVAQNHFFRGRGESGYDGDLVYFQGHASPGPYSRARFLEGRLTEANLRQLPPRVTARRRSFVLSAPVANAKLLGVPNRFDGSRTDHVDLPSSIQSVPGGPWHSGYASSARLGVLG